jgi:mannose-1-phosphate guanylyltransferase
MNYGIILAGGKGERFWPLSRRDHPKQLLKLTSDKTMLEETLDRLDGFIPPERTLIVTGVYLEEQIKELTKNISGLKLLFEPLGKNTCLALALAAAHIRIKDPKGVMVVLSSDHMIEPKDQLVRMLSSAADLAAHDNKLITIGIVPGRAETGYGYIEMGPKTSEINGVKFHSVIKFKEKPERTKAQEYYLDRRHLWNSGMFVWSVETFLNALNKYMPEMSACLDKYFQSISTKGNGEALKCLYDDCESISVDFAILEKADNVLCVKGEVKWDDVGSWLALERIHTANQEGNVMLGNVLLDSSYENTVVNSGDDGLIVGFGITDLVVVKSGKIVMVAHKTRVNEIKELLSRLDKDDKFKQYL